ncbi:tRNA-specific adenosine deaminase 1-like isoform X2 [Physella acuta]|uniref:tRNA-specific adenosine deaminase 1-like isoform X2 n=1 Tax=Physella acuta TaxID=109671 RepID=UPI0027DE8816|nr:tRNA-specific adenosine deaminase 1-like isoform X2 [Physella acuta]
MDGALSNTSNFMPKENQYNSGPELAREIASAVFNAYKKLPKKGKPQQMKEWTLLSGVVMRVTDNSGVELKTVSLGTGSKCIGKSKMSPKGDVLNDSHAEVLARRAFLRFLYNELRKAYENNSSQIFTSPDASGDASIFPKHANITEALPHIQSDTNTQRKDFISDLSNQSSYLPVDLAVDSNNFHRSAATVPPNLDSDGNQPEVALKDKKFGSPPIKKRKIELMPDDDNDNIGHVCGKESITCERNDNLSQESFDIYRTGAKCVPGGEQDSLRPAAQYHTVGVLRTKPGRGERTESMSCSDKIAKWNVLGCQGALLSIFLKEPIYFTSLVVGKCPYSAESLARAVYSRIAYISATLPPPYKVNQPLLYQAEELEFEASKQSLERIKTNNQKIVPSSSAVIWYLSETNSHDVTVNGRRQGITKNDVHKSKARSFVCSLSLFQCFHELVSKIEPKLLPEPLRCENLKVSTYWQTKCLAQAYEDVWSKLQESALNTWLLKPRELMQFHFDVS